VGVGVVGGGAGGGGLPPHPPPPTPQTPNPQSPKKEVDVLILRKNIYINKKLILFNRIYFLK